MKKIILVIILLIVSQLSAEEYIVSIDNSSYKNSVKIKCGEGLVLNETNTCVNSVPTCELPLVLNDEQNACESPTESVDWIYTTGDSCNGMRQSNFHPNVYFARAKNAVYQAGLTIPDGYHWMTKNEYMNLFYWSTVTTKNNAIFNYIHTCGISGSISDVNNVLQFVFLFSDTGTKGIHNNNYELHTALYHSYDASIGFAGLMLYKDN
jgi:hypothetical protein